MMMTGKQTMIYEMLTRVREFGASYPTAFAEGSHAATLLTKISGAVDEVTGSSAAQAAGSDLSRAGSASRKLARETLLEDVDTISRTARVIARRVPELEGRFGMPRRMRSQTLLDTARAFVADSVPWREEFARLALGGEFWARVESDIETLERALSAQRRGRETRTTAAAVIRRALEEGAAAVRELDVLVKNFFARNDVALSAWTAASRVQRVRGGRTRSAGTAIAAPAEPTPAEVGG